MSQSGDTAASLDNFVDNILNFMSLSPANDFALEVDDSMNYYYQNGDQYKKSVWRKGENEWELSAEEDISESDVRNAIMSSRSS